jgi:hypothetical protein
MKGHNHFKFHKAFLETRNQFKNRTRKITAKSCPIRNDAI